MSNYLDRAGIFMAMPASWKVKTFPNSSSVAISIEFRILAQLDGSEWTDWTSYDEVRCWGDFFVVKKDGKPNVATVQQLAASIGWQGSLRQVVGGAPPEVKVQITVKDETYNGKTFFKASWINPEDYVPTGGGADADEVGQLDARFGSLLRAAASGSGKPPASKPKTAPAPSAEAAPAGAQDDGRDYGTIPF